MDSDAWARLSEWHNQWLAAAPGDRDRLRQQFVADHPALTHDVAELVTAGAIAPGFLETPALALALDDLAALDATLEAGTALGPYLIVSLIARGGMGQVYRATDVRLGRDVALKLVSGTSEPEPGVVERFIQEARMTAALDRPNIVRLFDVGMHEGRPFLVMELLEGETLRARLARGPLPWNDAIRITQDVARGLVAAHAAGLIHHDLKPENLFLTRAGVTKILDFGIARLSPSAPAQTVDDLTTSARRLVGTAGYLAPEAILGERAGVTADLFALGAIAYEMLSGQRAFKREHTIDTLYAVLHDEVPPLPASAGAPVDLTAIVSRLLQKAPADRFQSAADLAWTLERLTDVPASSAPTPAAPTRRRLWPAVGIATAVAAALLIAVVWGRRLPAPAAPTTALAQFTWQLPDGQALLSAPIVAPNGRRVAFVGGTRAGRRLYVRDLASLSARTLAGTEDAHQPFWSSDGTQLGFFARGRLFRISADGGTPVALADAPDPRGGSWSAAGVIVFAPLLRDSPILQVRASGGPATPVTTLDVAAGEVAHRWPAFLPDGKHLTYLVLALSEERRGIYATGLDDTGRTATRLFPSESGATYVPPAGDGLGLLLTAARHGVEARRLDLRTMTIVGDARRLPLTAAVSTPHDSAMLDATADVLALASQGVPWGSVLVAASPADGRVETIGEPELGGMARLSPDGRRLVGSWVDTPRGNPDLWVRDLDRGAQLRVTGGAEFDVAPVWSPGGDRLAYRTGPANAPHLAITAADGTGTPSILKCPAPMCQPSDWSSDGQRLLVTAGGDVWTVPVDSTRAAAPLVTGPSVQRDARLSPDGRWVAYVSDETGRPEVSIRSVTGREHRVVVSNGGGDQPVWKHDGSALFYVNDDGLLFHVAVHTSPGGAVALDRARRVNVPVFAERHLGTNYDISADESRVYMQQPPDARPPNEMTIVLGWRALLR